MRVSAKADYAVRAMVELAAAGEGPVKGDRIAQAQEIPDQLPREHHGRPPQRRSRPQPPRGRRRLLARPHRGGDHARRRDPRRRRTAGEPSAASGRRRSAYAGSAEPLAEVWIAVRASLRRVLEAVTLADIASGGAARRDQGAARRFARPGSPHWGQSVPRRPRAICRSAAGLHLRWRCSLTTATSQRCDSWVSFLRAHSAITRQLNADLLAAHGLTLNDYEVLLRLLSRRRRHDAPGRPGRDASSSPLPGSPGCSTGSSAPGWSRRPPARTDARVSYAKLTDAGRRSFEQAAATHLRGDRRALHEPLHRRRARVAGRAARRGCR